MMKIVWDFPEVQINDRVTLRAINKKELEKILSNTVLPEVKNGRFVGFFSNERGVTAYIEWAKVG